MGGETALHESGLTVDTLRLLLDALDRRILDILDERDRRYAQLAVERENRYSDLDTERDRRYEQRFVAQEAATKLAFSQALTETRAAFEASDKAIQKAEGATEKRFESVNEFRAQLGDQAARLLSKDEAAAVFAGLEARASTLGARLDEKTDSLDKRIAALALDARGFVTTGEMNEARTQTATNRETMLPRQEANVLFDALAKQIAGVARTAGELNNTIVGLRASLSGTATGGDEARETANRSRNVTIAVAGVVVAVIAVVSGLFLGLRSHTVYVPSIPATTPTTAVK